MNWRVFIFRIPMIYVKKVENKDIREHVHFHWTIGDRDRDRQMNNSYEYFDAKLMHSSRLFSFHNRCDGSTNEEMTTMKTKMHDRKSSKIFVEILQTHMHAYFIQKLQMHSDR